MKDLINDIRSLLAVDARVQDVQMGGGIIALASLDLMPQQIKAPAVLLISDTVENRHFSSAVVWRVLRIRVHCVQRVFSKDEIVAGGPFVKSIEEIAGNVRHVLDMNRMGGKYARAFCTGEEDAKVMTSASIHLQEKALTFEYHRVES